MKRVWRPCIISPDAFMRWPYLSSLEKGLHRVKKSRVNKRDPIPQKVDCNWITIPHIFPEGSKAHCRYVKLSRNFDYSILGYNPVGFNNFRAHANHQIVNNNKKVYVSSWPFSPSGSRAEENNSPYEAAKLSVDFVRKPVGSIHILFVIALKVGMLFLR